MSASFVGVDDDDDSSKFPFSMRQQTKLISEHKLIETRNCSPNTFCKLLDKAKQSHHQILQPRQTFKLRPRKLDKKSKAISKNTNNSAFCPRRPIRFADIGEETPNLISAPICSPIEDILPEEHPAEVIYVADKIVIESELETKGIDVQNAPKKAENNYIYRQGNRLNELTTDATHLRRSARTNQPNLPAFDLRPAIPAEKRSKYTAMSSKYDFGNNYAASDQIPIGGKQHIAGRGAYHTNQIDANYGADLVYRQQLQEMAASMGSLCNIGNSCYMNSVIYTLRYTPLFLHNLHHLVSDFAQIFNQKENQQKLKSASLGRNVNGLQGPNARSYSSKDLVSLGSSSSSTVSLPTLEIAKTTQQKASEKLHDLFQCLSNNENAETVDPHQSDVFLKAIQDVNPIFEGNQQQDAHEFLMCILDSIRETCQMIKKNVIEHPEIIMQGYNSVADQVERQIVKPIPAPPQPIVEKKSSSGFLFKKKKVDKSKSMRVDSPSKELRNSSEVASSSNAAFAAIAVSPQPMVNGVGGSETSPSSAESVLEKILELGIDFFSEDFEGVTTSSTLCLSCETITEQMETMLDLAVPITENMETQELDEFFIQNLCITRERFQGDNKFRCEKCTGYTEAIRQISYPKLPRLLVIQLKRFSGGMEKINSYIPTPFTLQCFCSKCYSKCDGPKDHEYKLYSVITHVGATMCAGHYIAYTCSLNLNSCYQHCPKDAYKNAQAAAAEAAAAAASAAVAIANASSGSNAVSGKDGKSNTTSSGSSSSVTEVVKSIFFRGKTSNSDATKNQKNCNGIKSITNGVENIQFNEESLTSSPTTNPTAASSGATTLTAAAPSVCPSIKCCSIKMKTMPNATTATANGGNNGMSNGDYTNHSRNGSSSSVYSEHDQYGQMNGGGNSSTAAATISISANVNSEPIWFMCDDDKIKAMPQHEFREMLLPNKKNMITPYLLFYARSDVYQSSH